MFVEALKWNPQQARTPKGSAGGGQFAATTVGAAVDRFKATYPTVAQHYARSSYTEMGSIEQHTRDVGREWALQLSADQLHGISTRFGGDVGKVLTAAIALHDIGKADAIESGAGKEAQHAHTIPILQDVLQQEGFSEQDVALATELLNHDLIGPLFRGYEGFASNEATVVAGLTEKAEKVGMPVADFVTLQLAFYQADASAYPYITQYMTQEPSGQWHFKGRKQIAAVEALTQVQKYDPAQPRDAHGRWVDDDGVTHVGPFVELYHGTSRLRANKILKEGFKIRAVAKPTMGGDPESSRDYIWLAKRHGAAQSYSEMHAHPTVLTVRLPVAHYERLKRNSGPDSVWSRETIPAKFVRKREYVRDKIGQFAKTPGGTSFDPKVKETWYQWTDDWHRTPEGKQPYGWDQDIVYVPPSVTHPVLRMKGIGTWGGSHQGSTAMTGEAAKQMGLPGWRELDPTDDAKAVVTRMLEEIHVDPTGAEEPLYHSFENVAGTTFTPGDRMDLPLLATAGKPETSYATRMEEEDQAGAPTVFAFPKGTRMVAYGKWPVKPTDRGYEEGNAADFGHVYSEAIIAGRFRVVKTETVYMGSQHTRQVTKHTPQLYGQVVHLEPIGYFNPATGQWENHG